jgi:hypothetical protein
VTSGEVERSRRTFFELMRDEPHEGRWRFSEVLAFAIDLGTWAAAERDAK